jgi:hypothetical protein
MTDAYQPRGRSMAELGALASQIFVPDEVAASIASYRARPDDVIISPYAKCGTTWLQQTFHTLRTGGDLDFDDISMVVPWIETAAALEVDLESPQRAAPRGFKSHLPFDQVPKGARYVVAFREPKDALVSGYKFMEGWFIQPGAVAVADYARMWFDKPGQKNDYWKHLLTWWAERDNPDVLLFSYEQMGADPRGCAVRLAAFCGIDLTDALLDRTLEHSSLAFMLRHKDKFSDPAMRRLSEVRCNLPPGGDSAKVRKGGSGGYGEVLPAEVAEAVDRTWREVIAPVTGFSTYADLDAAIRARL